MQMKLKYTLPIYFFIICMSVKAQTAKDYAVMIRATVNPAGPSITLSWLPDTAGTGYVVYRKDKSATDWGDPVTTLPKTTLQYSDLNVVVGKGYEYYVRRTYASPKRLAHGYIYSAIGLYAPVSRGKMLLLVDENYAAPLAAEIRQLQNDLAADGWFVKRKNIARSTAVTAVKAIIKNEYNLGDTGAAKFKALYLLGRIAVPYSGYIFPDGHTPEHRGAWPADVYYGVMNDDLWTDNTVSTDSATDARNHNLPGDGKFDTSYVYQQGNDVALQIGRVDLSNMPMFAMSDTLLIKQYLAKAHAFKTGQVPVVRRAVIDDGFGVASGEAFASPSWSDFSVMFGDSVVERKYFSSLRKENYLFSYGSGFGNFTTCFGIGNTDSFNTSVTNTVFTMLFGSFFGDWDSQDNLLRAALCSKPSALANVWSGRPYWHFHHMALGENIGYAAQLAQSNYSDFSGGNHFGYSYNTFPTFVHVALMGDPSLRLHYFAPVTGFNIAVKNNAQNVLMSWNKSADPELIGYGIFRSRDVDGPFEYITSVEATDTAYLDLTPFNGKNIYMVKVLKLEQTPSGSYFNTSLGVMDSVFAVNTAIKETHPSAPAVTIYPNPSSGRITVYLDRESAGEITIDCYDMTGRLVKHVTSETFVTDLDLSGNKGLVLIRVSTGNNETIQKVLVTE